MERRSTDAYSDIQNTIGCEAPFAAASNPKPNLCIQIIGKDRPYLALPARQLIKTMHLIVGILIGIVFFILLTKAIIETFWGIFLIVSGLVCNLLASVLQILAKIIRLVGKTRHQTPVTEEQEPLGVVSSFMLVNSYRREQSDRLSPAHQNRKSKVCLKQH